MDVRTRPALARLSLRFRERVVLPVPCSASGLILKPGAILIASIWFGMAAGLGETATLFAKKYVLRAAVLGSLQMNQHATWMISVSNLLVFIAFGVALAPLGWWRSPRLSRAIVLSYSTALGMVLAMALIRGFATISYVMLAGGLGACLTRRIARHGNLSRSVVRRSLPVFAAAILLLYGLDQGVPGLTKAPAAAPQLPAGTPNVLWIVLDTVRAESLGLYGYDRPTSPNLDRLGRQGVRFDMARSTASWTLPSHASMFTGMWPHQLSARIDVPLDRQKPTIAEYLGSKGYATAGFVANTFFCNAWYGLGRGFRHYEDSTINLATILQSSGLGRRLAKHLIDSPTDRPHAYTSRLDANTVTQGALDWLATRDRRPFFVFMNLFDAHDPYILPEGEKSPQSFRVEDETEGHREILRNWHQNPLKNSQQAIRLARDAYDEGIAYLDQQLGLFLQELRHRGDLENTLIVVTADHGELLGEHGEFGHGNSLRRQLTHVPLLIVPPPGQKVPASVAAPVSLRDLPATVVDLVDLAEDAPFPGTSLARFWSSSDEVPPAPVLSEVEEVHGVLIQGGKLPRSLVTQGRTYIRQGDGREELYDLENDPQEANNLVESAEEAAILQNFRETMAEFDQSRRAARP